MQSKETCIFNLIHIIFYILVVFCIPATCQFHHKFSAISYSQKGLEIFCNRTTKPNPTWIVRNTGKPLPECEFYPRICPEEKIVVIPNAKVSCEPGVVEGNATKSILPHKCLVECNENGYYLSRGTRPFKSSSKEATCSNKQTFICAEDSNREISWYDQSGLLSNEGDISCKRG